MRSSECKDIYSKNHGGNFQIELNEPLRLQGSWEVALAEMTYHGQSFPNLPPQYASVQVTLKEQLQVYDTKDKDFRIRTWVWHDNKWVLSDSFEIPSETRFPHIIELPKKNYDWQEFKEAVEGIGKQQDEGTTQRVTNIKFAFKEHVLHYQIVSTLRTCFTFSQDLVEFLSLSESDVYQAPSINYYHDDLAFVKPLLPCEKYIIWPEDLTDELWVKIDDTKFDIPKTSNNEEVYFIYRKFDKRHSI